MKKKRSLRKPVFLGISAVLIVSALLLFQDKPVEEPVVEQQQIIEEQEIVQDPVLTVSASFLEQSDTVVVRLENVSEGVVPTGTFLSKDVSFFQTGSSWMAILGLDAKRTPGNYTLLVTIGDRVLERQISLAKRTFPITKLVVTQELEEQGYTPETIAENIAVVENRKLQEVLSGYSVPFFADKPFYNPLNRMVNVGAYGNIRQSGDISLQHLGVDLDAVVGDNVYNVNDGIVVLSDNFTNYGKIIVIDHGYGIYSLYLHLDKRFVVVGESVSRGEIIAHAGNTGYSIAPHLHFSFKVVGESVDPLGFIETVNAAF